MLLAASLFSPATGTSAPSFPQFVKDIIPGPAGSDILNGFDFNGRFLFTAEDIDHGGELWISDGSDLGTTIVKDTNPGSPSGGAAFLTSFHGQVYFITDNPETGRELWRTDGTEEGTTVAVDFISGPADSTVVPLAVVNDKMILAADDASSDLRLWSSDGTPGGTQLIPGQGDLEGGTGISIVDKLVYNNEFYTFTAVGGSAGVGGSYYLCKTDGNSFSLIKDVGPIYNFDWIPYVKPRYLTESGGFIYFSGKDHTLWRSDGTSAGTVSLGSQATNGSDELADVNGTLLELYDEPYYWNGTSKVLLKDIYPGSGSSDAFRCSGDFQGRRLFAATDNVNGQELWITDGTAANTHLVSDINPGIGSSTPITITHSDLNFAMLTADNPTYGREMWITDGTSAGTYVMDMLPGTASSTASGGWEAGNYIYLRIDDGVHGSELWKMDKNSSSSVSDWQMYE
jgi:ELWxxDGT repeat protein